MSDGGGEAGVIRLTPRALLHLLFNGERARDVLETACATGLAEALSATPVRLGELAQRFGFLPQRLYKFLDCLESLALVRRVGEAAVLDQTAYVATGDLAAACAAVFGAQALERDRESYDWRALHGRLDTVLRGEHRMPEASFAWPPQDAAQLRAFEASMAAGLGPIAETFARHAALLLTDRRRLLDVGGGDGSLAARLLARAPGLHADVFNLPGAAALVAATARHCATPSRLGFVGGDFLTGELPSGYDLLAFVRVLHDWPDEIAVALLRKAHAALPPGGRIAICEEFRTPERLAAQFFWSYFLIGVDACSSRLRDVEFYTRCLAEAGFCAVDVLPGPFQIITALRS